MNYCPIQDAWGVKEHMTDIKNTQKRFTCDDFIEHLETCTKCRNYVRDKYRPKLLYTINSIIDDNRDLVLLIMTGMSLALIVNIIR